MLTNKIDYIFCVLSNSCSFKCVFSHYWFARGKTKNKSVPRGGSWSDNLLIIYSVLGAAGDEEVQQEIRPSLQLIWGPHLKMFTTKNKTFHTILTDQ